MNFKRFLASVIICFGLSLHCYAHTENEIKELIASGQLDDAISQRLNDILIKQAKEFARKNMAAGGQIKNESREVEKQNPLETIPLGGSKHRVDSVPANKNVSLELILYGNVKCEECRELLNVMQSAKDIPFTYNVYRHNPENEEMAELVDEVCDLQKAEVCDLNGAEESVYKSLLEAKRRGIYRSPTLLIKDHKTNTIIDVTSTWGDVDYSKIATFGK